MPEVIESDGVGIEIHVYDHDKRCGCGRRTESFFGWAEENEAQARCMPCFFNDLLDGLEEDELVLTDRAGVTHV